MRYTLRKRGGLWRLTYKGNLIGAYRDYAHALHILNWKLNHALQNRKRREESLR